MSTPQEYWDACLIKTWRNIGTLQDACNMFKDIMGKWPDDYDPPLLRYPVAYVPYGVQMQYFVASYLPKMSDWLWSHPPDKDVELLRKVTKSKYTTAKKYVPTQEDKERAKITKQHRKDRELRTLRTEIYSTRNSATDWNVIKPASKYRGGRRK